MGTTLTIIMFVLKLLGVIQFGWFLVFLPVLIEAALGLTVMLFVLIMARL